MRENIEYRERRQFEITREMQIHRDGEGETETEIESRADN